MYDLHGVLTASGLQAATVVITDRDGTTWTFAVFDQGFGPGNRGARLVAITERTGVVREAITYVYPTSALTADFGGDRLRLWEVARVTAADGTFATFAYDNSVPRGGHYAVSYMTLPNGATTSFAYSGDDLTEVTLPDGTAATFAVSYDTVLQKVKTVIRDPAAEPDHQFKTVWWTGSSFIEPDNTVIPQTVGHLRRVDNGAGETVLVAWSGAPISPTAAAAPTYWWHADQGLVFYDVTQAAIMPTARARSEHFVLGQDPFTAVLSEFENFAPDIIHEVHRGQTDPLGQQRSADYDLTNRRVTRFTDYDGSTRTASYNAFSLPLIESDPVGRQTTFTYDAHGNRLSKTMGSDSETSTWRWEYDTRGLTTAAIDANGNRTEYAYDANGHLVELIEPADVAGGSRAHQYFTYDTASQLTSHTDASGRTVTYAYDLRSRVIRTTYADASTELTTYGAGLLSGLEVAKQDRNQHLTTFGYDAAGRRVHTEWASSTPEVLVEDCV
jgi:YD repeat-containing protein